MTVPEIPALKLSTSSLRGAKRRGNPERTNQQLQLKSTQQILNKMLKTSDFDFHLPQELIANQPASPRDSARMLVWKGQKIIDKNVRDLADFLDEGDVLVLNDTKVIKAKLIGKRGEAKVEINLHKNLQSQIWQAFAKPAKRLKIGDKFIIADDFFAVVIAKNSDGIVDLEFNVDGNDFFSRLEKYGQMPLPPYIKKEATSEDNQNYQTIYAANSGAVAAPTAGLHFTEELFQKLEAKGIKKVFVTLNVGAGTFLPVKSDFIKDHQMHEEYFSIKQEACDVINEAKKNGKKIIAVGTTSLRVLESAIDENGQLKAQNRETKIFIHPPYNFKIVDILMTNFHLPKSTLFMLISAFIGKENAHQLYNHAISNQYRFYSFGDATLLFKQSKA
ncbi:MAG: queA [Rickettsiaceae bacterium]|jgi:S-adenosylmethionine:tRNA ribosyltransferase-isomerase|nr:queA [Rickettsiaceae bacterium]